MLLLIPLLALSGLALQLVIAVVVVCILLGAIWTLQTYVPAPFSKIGVIVLAVVIVIFLLLLALSISGLG